jgi:hypothetical protein
VKGLQEDHVATVLDHDVDRETLPLVILRFNPDSYVDAAGRTVASCWRKNGQGIDVLIQPYFDVRMEALLARLRYWIYEAVPDKALTKEFLFYSHNSVSSDDV